MKLTYASEIDGSGRRMVVCDCGFERLTHVPIERIVHTCESHRAASERRRMVPELSETPTPTHHGPGTELSKIITALGVAGKCGGGCPKWIAKMNAWGPDGCESHRDEILAHLNEAYAAINPSWTDKATIAA